MVGEDDLADRLVAIDLGDDSRPLVWVLLDRVPLGVGERGRPDFRMLSGSTNLPMSCSRPAEWTSSCSSRESPARGRDLARVARDGGAVAGGHPVAQIERPQERREQRDLEAGELAGAQLELVAAVLGDQQGTDEVLEDQDDHAEQGDRGGAGLDVGGGERRAPACDAANSDGSTGRRRGGPWSRSSSAST